MSPNEVEDQPPVWRALVMRKLRLTSLLNCGELAERSDRSDRTLPDASVCFPLLHPRASCSAAPLRGGHSGLVPRLRICVTEGASWLVPSRAANSERELVS